MANANPFTQLKEQVEEADRSISAAAQGAEELRSMVEEARKHADDGAAQLRAKSDQAFRRGRGTLAPGSERLGSAHQAPSRTDRREEGEHRR